MPELVERCKDKPRAGEKYLNDATFQSIRGVKALPVWAETHPGDFYSLWIKLLPKSVEVEGGERKRLIIRIVRE